MNKKEIIEKDFQIELFSNKLFNITSFFLTSKQESILIDPIFEPELYTQLITKKTTNLKYIFLTKKPFEYISNYDELTQKYKIELIYKPKENTLYNFGNVSIKSSNQGGFTEDSTNYILINSDKKEKAVFTGGNILIGTIGNPYYKELNDIKKNQIKEKLYNDIQYLKSLDKNVYLFPSYINSNGNCDTIENEIKINEFFNLSKDNFYNKISFQNYNPFYEQISIDNFPKDKSIENIYKSIKKLTVSEIEKYSTDENLFIIDTRPLSKSNLGFIKNSIFFPIDISFTNWTLKLLYPKDNYILIVEKSNEEEEIIKNFFRLGFPNIIGYFNYEDWVESGKNSEKLTIYPSTKENIEKLVNDKKCVIDIREINEYIESGIISHCFCIPFSTFKNKINDIPKNDNIYITCRGGGRAAMAITYLIRKGFKNNFYNIEGGMMKVINSGYSTVKYEK